MTEIDGAMINRYIIKRQSEVTTIPARTVTTTRKGTITIPERQKHVANATINREIAWLKHMFRLAVDAGKLMTRPKIVLLKENNARQGFFERYEYEAVLRQLPGDLRPVVTFAYITGWRVKSEVLSLEWRRVDLKAAEVRLEIGTTKNHGPHGDARRGR
ncbi:MAG: hypothetical protein DMF84_04625 [Acidobacteria bacterium]|nr:MAG: hypothetical protein DMF84_04625 [Acidobacteriota bacterium]